MLFKDLLSETMQRRILTIHDVQTLSNVSKKSIMQYLEGIVPSEKDEISLCESLHIDPNDITYDEYNISVNEARKIMQCSPEFVKYNIRKGRLPGCWREGVKRDNYHIPRKAFMEYMENWNNDEGLQKQVDELAQSVKVFGSAVLELIGYVDALKKSLPTTNDEATKVNDL